jgi:NTE family protein
VALMPKKTNDRKPVDLVLEGGGVKGIGLLGAVLALYDAGYRFERIAGTSAGAIVASLVAAYQQADRDLHELEDVMRDVDYQKFADDSLLERLTGRIGEGIELLLHDGAHTGNYLQEWLAPLLEGVGVKTFADLRLTDPGSSLAEYQRYSLVVHASDLTRRVLVRLPWDYDQYGQDADHQLVVDAVRASMSIPFFFRPIQVATDKGTSTWVDGGLLSNFPITVFDRTDGKPARWPTWGVKVSTSPPHGEDRPVRTAVGLGVRCLATMTGDWWRSSLGADTAGRRTIQVDTSSVPATQFDVDNRARLRLYENGRAAATAFLEHLS